MKTTLFLLFVLGALPVAGQNEPVKNREAAVSLNSSIAAKASVPDTIPTVEYIKPENTAEKPAVYLGEKLVDMTLLKTIDPNLIEDIRVDKKEIQVDGRRFTGQIFLKMKNGYRPKLTTLADLRTKYLHPGDKPVLFMIDNDLVTGDGAQYLVDENYILKIVVESPNTGNLEFIRLLTKSEENIRKSKEIRIRGLTGS